MPFALLEASGHGLQIACPNLAARKLGVETGLRFTDARARAPDLQTQNIDREEDAKALRAVADWLIRVAPLVAINGREHILLETTGCAGLYGGEAGLVETVAKLLDQNGLPHQMGLASTPVTATALALSQPGACLADGEEHSGLAGLPISALRLTTDATQRLRRFGLTKIGQLYGIDRKALGRRFQSKDIAENVLLKLDQALGLRADPMRPFRSEPTRTARLPCPEPIASQDSIWMGLETLTAELCQQLSVFGQGARSFTLHAFRSDGTSDATEIKTARPVRTPAHILTLFKEKLDKLDPGFGIDLLILEARRTDSMSASSRPLASELAVTDTDPVALAALTDRITAKLGPNTVRITDLQASHLPETSQGQTVFAGQFPHPQSVNDQAGPRPLRLFSTPERVEVIAQVPEGPPLRFVWRRVARHVSRADGPERINPEWWTYSAPPPAAASPDGARRPWLTPKLDPRADAQQIADIRAKLEDMELGAPVRALPRTRDYYRVEDRSGRRYWIFRDGLYGDDRGRLPEWFVHGVFA